MEGGVKGREGKKILQRSELRGSQGLGHEKNLPENALSSQAPSMKGLCIYYYLLKNPKALEMKNKKKYIYIYLFIYLFIYLYIYTYKK